MGFVLYHLASHNDVQDRVRQEILQKIAKYEGRLTYEALMEMDYMNQVFNGKSCNEVSLSDRNISHFQF